MWCIVGGVGGDSGSRAVVAVVGRMGCCVVVGDAGVRLSRGPRFVVALSFLSFMVVL